MPKQTKSSALQHYQTAYARTLQRAFVAEAADAYLQARRAIPAARVAAARDALESLLVTSFALHETT